MALSKGTVTTGAVGGMTVGGCLPMLWGDYNTFDATSTILGMVGGFVGIWLVVVISKRFG